MSIRKEDDLLYMLYKEMQKLHAPEYQIFPKISEIPKGKDNTITPDIDLLKVRPRDKQKSSQSQSEVDVVGYEVKFLRYRKKSRSFNLDGFYKGLGQVLCYFQYGVKQAYLVVGLSDAPKDIIEKTERHIQQIWNFLTKRFSPIGNYVSIDIRTPPYSESLSFVFIPTGMFPVMSNEDIKYKYECLIRLKFTWAGKWLSEMKKQEDKQTYRKNQ